MTDPTIRPIHNTTCVGGNFQYYQYYAGLHFLCDRFPNTILKVGPTCLLMRSSRTDRLSVGTDSQEEHATVVGRQRGNRGELRIAPQCDVVPCTAVACDDLPVSSGPQHAADLRIWSKRHIVKLLECFIKLYFYSDISYWTRRQASDGIAHFKMSAVHKSTVTYL